MRGITWLTRACDHGNDKGRPSVSLVLHQRREFVEIDYNKAFKQQKKFADQDNIWGLSSLGTLYSEGIGCDKNDILAFKYTKKRQDLELFPPRNMLSVSSIISEQELNKMMRQPTVLLKLLLIMDSPACFELGRVFTEWLGSISKKSNEGFPLIQTRCSIRRN